MLTENDVVDAVAAYLPSLGYTVESTCTTTQTGVDIVARNDATGRHMRLEAKGGTSSTYRTARFSLPFNYGQVGSHVSGALFKAAALLGKYPADEVALALPDDENHRARIKAIGLALSRLGIGVFLVAADRKVSVWTAEL